MKQDQLFCTASKTQVSHQQKTNKKTQSRKIQKSKHIEKQKQILDKFITQNVRLKTTINDLKVITLKLKRNQDIFKQGRLIQKAKIDKLVQDVQRKKEKIFEKDVVIEGLTFELEKLSLKIDALQKYQDLHSPMYISMLKKDPGKVLSIQQKVFDLLLNTVNYLPNESVNLERNQNLPLAQSSAQNTLQQLQLESKRKQQQKRCHQCDVYYEQNRELKLKLLNQSEDELQKEILRLQKLEVERLRVINQQTDKIGKSESIFKGMQSEVEFLKQQNILLKEREQNPKSDSQLQKQLTEAKKDNVFLTCKLTDLQNECQQLYRLKQQLEQKLESVIPQLESELDAYKVRSYNDEELIIKIRNELMNEKAVHNDVENMLRDALSDREQESKELNQQLINRESQIQHLKIELFQYEQLTKSNDETVRVLQKKLVALEREVSELKNELASERKTFDNMSMQNVTHIEHFKRQIEQLKAQIDHKESHLHPKEIPIIKSDLDFKSTWSINASNNLRIDFSTTNEPVLIQQNSGSNTPDTILTLKHRIHQLQVQNKQLYDLLQSAGFEHRISLQFNSTAFINQMKLLSEDISSRKELCEEFQPDSKRTIRSDDDSEDISLEHVDRDTLVISHNPEGNLQTNLQLSQNPLLSLSQKSQQLDLELITHQLIVEKTQRIELQGQNEALKLTIAQKSTQLYQLKSRLQHFEIIEASNRRLEHHCAQLSIEISLLNEEKKQLLQTILKITQNIATVNNHKAKFQEAGSIRVIHQDKQLVNDFSTVQDSQTEEQKYSGMPQLIKSLKGQINTSLCSVKKLTHALHSKKTLLSTQQVSPSAFSAIFKPKQRTSINSYELVTTPESVQFEDPLYNDGEQQNWMAETYVLQQPQDRQRSFRELLRSANQIQEEVRNFVMKSQDEIEIKSGNNIGKEEHQNLLWSSVPGSILAKLAIAEALLELIKEGWCHLQIERQDTEYNKSHFEQSIPKHVINNERQNHPVEQPIISRSLSTSTKKLTLSPTEYQYSIIDRNIFISDFNFEHKNNNQVQSTQIQLSGNKILEEKVYQDHKASKQVSTENQGARHKGRELIQQLILITEARKELNVVKVDEIEMTNVRQINDEFKKILQEFTADDDEQTVSEELQKQGTEVSLFSQLQGSHKEQNSTCNQLNEMMSRGSFLYEKQENSRMQPSRDSAPNIKTSQSEESSINNRSSHERPSHRSSNSEENEYIAMIGELEKELSDIKQQLRLKLSLEKQNEELKNVISRLNDSIQQIYNGRVVENHKNDKNQTNQVQTQLKPVKEEEEDGEEDSIGSLNSREAEKVPNNHLPNNRINETPHGSVTSLDQVHVCTQIGICINNKCSFSQSPNEISSPLLQQSLQVLLSACRQISIYVENYEQLPPASLNVHQSNIQDIISHFQFQHSSALKEMYHAVKYRLKLLKKLESEKYLHIESQEKEIFQLKQEIEKKEQLIQAQKDKIQHIKLCQSRNEEMLIENIQLHKNISELKTIVEKYRDKITHYEQSENKVDNKSLTVERATINECIRCQHPDGFSFQQAVYDKKCGLEQHGAEVSIIELSNSRTSELFKLSVRQVGLVSSGLNKGRQKGSVEVELALDFMKQLLAEIESIEESVIGIETEMQKNYHLLKSLAKKKNLLMASSSTNSISKIQYSPSPKKHSTLRQNPSLLPSLIEPMSSLTSILNPNSPFTSCQPQQDSLIASEYCRIVKELQLKLEDNERMMQEQKIKVHKEFTDLMNDILILEEGEHISRDRFRGYLERVTGVNGSLNVRSVKQLGQSEQDKNPKFFCPEPQAVLFRDIITQLEQLVTAKSQQLHELTNEQLLITSPQIYITSKFLQQQKWFNHNSTIEYESQHQIVEDDNESESESEVKDDNEYTESEHLASNGRGESARRETTENTYGNANQEANGTQLEYETLPNQTDNHQKQSHSQVPLQTLINLEQIGQTVQPTFMSQSVQLMEVSLNSEELTLQRLKDSREVSQ